MRFGRMLVFVLGVVAAAPAAAESAPLALECGSREHALERRLCDRANSGDLGAAMMFADTLDMEREGGTAIRLYRFVAAAGDPRGLFGLAQMYRDGGSLPPDQRTALRLLHAAAEQGLVQAERELAQIYLRGQETDLDLTEAARWQARVMAHRTAMND